MFIYLLQFCFSVFSLRRYVSSHCFRETFQHTRNIAKQKGNTKKLFFFSIARFTVILTFKIFPTIINSILSRIEIRFGDVQESVHMILDALQPLEKFIFGNTYLHYLYSVYCPQVYINLDNLRRNLI